MQPTSPAVAVTWLAWCALGVLAILTVCVGIVIVPSARSAADVFPEFADLETPLLAASLAFLACVEAGLGVIAVLVGFIRDGRIFSPAARRLVVVLILVVVTATAVLCVVLSLIPGPPALALALLVGIVTGVVCALVLIVLMSLLARASSMRVELDEVV